jgi:hypothetical protein
MPPSPGGYGITARSRSIAIDTARCHHDRGTFNSVAPSMRFLLGGDLVFLGVVLPASPRRTCIAAKRYWPARNIFSLLRSCWRRRRFRFVTCWPERCRAGCQLLSRWEREGHKGHKHTKSSSTRGNCGTTFAYYHPIRRRSFTAPRSTAPPWLPPRNSRRT